MKTTQLLSIGLLAATSVFFVACGGENKSHDDTNHADSTATTNEAQSVTYNVNTDQSNVKWKGTMVGADLLELYSHWGNVKLSEGTISLKGNEVVSGSFVIDMTSINPTDSNYSEAQPASKLVGHLGSDDFFAISENPTSSFEIISAEGNTATGTLTIRGKSGEATVENIAVSEENGNKVVTGELTFDRQNYDVHFDMGMQDKIVSDDIKLEIKLVASK
jgi:polyisoprenoid-binding protein YceI